MKFKLIILVVLTCTMSCTSLQYGNYYPSVVTFDKANFEIVNTLKGTSKQSYLLFGLIGINGKDGMVADAKKNMTDSVKLGKNQTLANVTIDERIKFMAFGLISEKIIVMTADVVQFNE